jgi:hypothetical protein
MRTLGTIAHFISDTACAVLYAVAIAVNSGILAAAYTHRLEPTLLATLGGLMLAGGCFGYIIWRTYAPARKSRASKTRSRELASAATS